MSIATIKINNIALEIDFDFEPAQSGGRADESWEAHVDSINTVSHKGSDITALMNDELYKDIEKAIMEAYKG